MLGTNIHQDVLHVRRPTLNYVSPAICEAIFSGSSFATLLLEQQIFDRLTHVIGPRFVNYDETTNTWQLEWDVYPDDPLCYNIYTANNPGDPNTTYTLVAECVPNPNYDPNNPTGGPGGGGGNGTPGTPGGGPTTPDNPGVPGGSGGGGGGGGVPGTPGTPGGNVVVTAVTPDGETPFPPAPPLTPPPPGGGGTTYFNVEVTITCPDGTTGDPVTIPAGTYSSLVSQEAADAQATAAGEAEIVCTPDGGGDTPCTLATDGEPEGEVSLQNIAGTTTVSFGDFPPGGYRITYLGGCHSDDDNPCPGFFKFASIDALYNNNGVVTDWLNGAGSVCDVDATACVNAVKAIRETLEFNHTGGAISMRFGRFGPPTNPGGSDPTFELESICVFPTLTEQVRISGYDAAEFTVCPTATSGSILPAWDGTFTFPASNPTCEVDQFYFWDAGNGTNSINGQDIVYAAVQYEPAIPYPTPTGCGWKLEIGVGVGVTLEEVLWTGYKAIGITPDGVYTRDSGCSAGPETLTIESY